MVSQDARQCTSSGRAAAGMGRRHGRRVGARLAGGGVIAWSFL